MDKLLCRACGKNMVSKEDKTLVGFHYRLTIDKSISEDELKFVELQLGKYFNPDGMDIQLCFECFLDSMFSNHNPYL